MITRKRLLYLNTHCLSVHRWQQGSLVDEDSFEANEDGLARFAAYLKTGTPSQFHLLANVAEEGFQVETIPFLHGRDRQTLIRRKLGQFFLGTPLATAITLGYEKSRRKNEQVLLTALTNPGHFDRWLACLRAAEVPLAGLFTVSQLGGTLLKKLGKLPERCLLLSLHNQSIRESLIVGGKTQFSRVAPILDSSIAGIAASFATEAVKLHQYLLGQRQISRNETIPAFILAHPQALAPIQSACIDSGGLIFDVLDSHEVATRIGLKTPPQDCGSESIFLHLLAVAPPAQQFLGEDLRHDYRILQIKQALVGIGGVTLLAALLFGAKQLYESHAGQVEMAELQAQENDLSRRYEAISATFPKLAIDNESLRKVIARFTDLQQLQRQPGEAYRVLSRALTLAPGIQLEGIDWRLGPATGSEGERGGNTKLPALTARDEFMTIRGSMASGQEASTREILATFDNFVRSLQADPGVRVEVVQRPFDIESGRTLKGGDKEDEKSRSRTFAIQVVRRPAS